MKNIFSLLLASFFIASPITAIAQDGAPSCPALSQASLYKANKLEAYETLSPGNNGYIFRTKTDYRTNFSLTSSTLKDLSTLNKIFKEKNITLVLFFIPTRGMAAYDYISADDRKLHNLIGASSLWDGYADMLESLNKESVIATGLEQKDISLPESFYYKHDHHWKPEGAKLGAAAVASKIKTLPVFLNLKKEQFATRKNGSIDNKGTFSKAYKTLCNIDLSPEKIHAYSTASPEQDNDLLNDNEVPNIILIGTSNSVNATSHTNFDGFLKEALQANILNLSQTGGGLSDAMLNYLSSPSYKSNLPSIIIWEIPAYYDLNKQNNFLKKAIEIAK